MKLSHKKVEIRLEGRVLEEMSEAESTLIDTLPTISLRSYVRTEQFPEGIIVDSIKVTDLNSWVYLDVDGLLKGKTWGPPPEDHRP